MKLEEKADFLKNHHTITGALYITGLTFAFAIILHFVGFLVSDSTESPRNPADFSDVFRSIFESFFACLIINSIGVKFVKVGFAKYEEYQQARAKSVNLEIALTTFFYMLLFLQALLASQLLEAIRFVHEPFVHSYSIANQYLNDSIHNLRIDDYTSIIFSLFIILIVIMYFVPSIVAYKRNHQDRLAILFINIFLGWSFFGWVASLIWSGTNVRRKS